MIDTRFWLGLCVAMIGFSFIVKFYFGVMKFDVDEAGSNLKKLILQKLLKAKHKFQSLFLKDFAIEIWANQEL